MTGKTFACFATGVLLLFVSMLPPAGAGAQEIRRAETPALPHPHDWIRRFRVPGESMDCCGKADCVRIPYDAAIRLRPGSLYNLPAVGMWKARAVAVKGLFPAPPGVGLQAWGCHTGCFFLTRGF